MRARALLPLAASGDGATLGIDTDPPESFERAVEQAVREHLEGARIETASIACQEATSTPSAKVGAIVRTDRCTVEQPVGEAFDVAVEHANAVEPDGTPMVSWSATTSDVVIVTAVEDRMAERFSDAEGVPLTARCDVPSVPGDTFDCTLSGGPEEQTVRATVTDAIGGVDYEILG